MSASVVFYDDSIPQLIGIKEKNTSIKTKNKKIKIFKKVLDK
jgi:hypothetical protein